MVLWPGSTQHVGADEKEPPVLATAECISGRRDASETMGLARQGHQGPSTLSFLNAIRVERGQLRVDWLPASGLAVLPRTRVPTITAPGCTVRPKMHVSLEPATVVSPIHRVSVDINRFK